MLITIKLQYISSGLPPHALASVWRAPHKPVVVVRVLYASSTQTGSHRALYVRCTSVACPKIYNTKTDSPHTGCRALYACPNIYITKAMNSIATVQNMWSMLTPGKKGLEREENVIGHEENGRPLKKERQGLY